MITSFGKLDSNQKKNGPYTGDIYKFTDIDRNAEWFNTKTNEPASEKEIENLVIPDNLKPNSARFTYIFYPMNHTLFYEGYYSGKQLGAKTVVRFFKNLFADQKIEEKFGKIDVTHIPERDGLTSAMKLPVKTRIEMEINRPNPDDHDDAEREFLRRMDARGVGTQVQTFKAIKGSSIEPDEETKTLAKISESNGKVTIKGKNGEGKIVEFSTSDHPLRITEFYGDTDSPFSILVRVAESLWENIRK